MVRIVLCNEKCYESIKRKEHGRGTDKKLDRKRKRVSKRKIW